jgi:hypothetical protein
MIIINNTVYVDHPTLQRWIEARRIGIWDLTRPVELRFHPADEDFPGALVGLFEDLISQATPYRPTPYRRHRRKVAEDVADCAGVT